MPVLDVDDTDRAHVEGYIVRLIPSRNDDGSHECRSADASAAATEWQIDGSVSRKENPRLIGDMRQIKCG